MVTPNLVGSVATSAEDPAYSRLTILSKTLALPRKCSNIMETGKTGLLNCPGRGIHH